MNSSTHHLQPISRANAGVPASCFEFPEKILQFGTGVLLRGLPDYFIDKANKQGIFNGRIVVIKSTSQGDADAFDRQQGLYTLLVRGVVNGKKEEEDIVNASISRVLSAKKEWDQILACAANPEMEIVISNTTEVGIVLTDDDVHAAPPESFPGKLLAILYHRFRTFRGDPSKGMVIIPTELIPDNGSKLRAIVLELARKNGLEATFTAWLTECNHFCNSLVDRIVPGRPNSELQKATEERLGRHDELMIMSEAYRLWAIEANNALIKNTLSFSKADAGVVIAPDINIFRTLKLRLLNGSHTFSCGLAYLAGFGTVKNAMENGDFDHYISHLMMEEIVPAIVDKNLPTDMAEDFAGKVLDRFRNPFIEHQWISITLQYSMKMKMRNVPAIIRYYDVKKQVPAAMALGFAAHILFMKTEKGSDGRYQGEWKGENYMVNDDNAAYYHEIWKNNTPQQAVHNILSNTSLWDTDLSAMPGFEQAVYAQLLLLMEQGPAAALTQMRAADAAVR